MTHLEYFKFQAKNLLHDWKYFQKNDITPELKNKSKFFRHDLYASTTLLFESELPLARAQHYVARLADFSKWTELAGSSEEELFLARIIYDGINCSYDLKHWKLYKDNSIYDEVSIAKKIELAKLFFKRHENDDKSGKEEKLDFRSFTGPAKLHAYLRDMYGITKAEFNQKPEWMKEELRKEHAEYLRQKQIQFSQEIKFSKMSKEELAEYEAEQERMADEYTAYVLLRECGVPFDSDGYPIGIGDD